MPAVATVERQGRAAVVRLHGDVVAASAPQLYGKLRGVCRRRDIAKVVVDFSQAGRVDSSGVAVLSMVGRQLERAGKTMSLEDMAPHHEAALSLAPTSIPKPEPVDHPGSIEQLGTGVLATGSSARALVALVAETLRQSLAVIVRKRKLPQGALAQQISTMGVDGIFIVALLSFLIGTTMAFQGAVQLQRFGASVFVADMIGL
ncbi:MAG TPA: STAS domain-containing protein, partial [Kofleriaceae bacterium]|nr:STAS domain-containing protein [Kofleriaceae bacterium]